MHFMMKLFLPALEKTFDETSKCLRPRYSQKLEPSLIRHFIISNKTGPSNLSCPSGVIKKFWRSQPLKKPNKATKCCVNNTFQEKMKATQETFTFSALG